MPVSPRFHRPLTIQRKEFPPPLVIDFRRGQCGHVSHYEYHGRLNARQKLADYRPSSRTREDSLTRAYLLLNCFQNIANLNLTLFDLRLDRLALELFLLCAIYSDADLMVVVIAFKLLELMIYGNEADPNLASLPSIYFKREIRELIDDYAKDFDFSSNFTGQMLAAFPIFWNHRYAHLASNERPVAYGPLKIAWNPPLSGEQVQYPKSEWERPPGLTPLEFYGRFLLEEPAVSDRFNGQVLRILRLVDSEQERLIATVSQDDYLDYQKILTEKAIILLDFLRTEFPFEGGIVDMRILYELLPLIPTDPIFSTVKEAAGHR
jgi:hypothetical protein